MLGAWCRAGRIVTGRRQSLFSTVSAAAAAAAAAAAGAADVKWLVAGLTHRDLGVEFTEAVELLDGIPPEQLREFQEALLSGEGKSVVYSNMKLSVIDSAEPGGALLRSLVFNARPNLVQTAVLVDAAGNVDNSRPPPIEGGSATHLQGLSLAVALHSLHRAAGRGATHSTPPRVCVLGAGGCSLPAHLLLTIPGATIDAVELSPAVLAAARDFFGVGALEAEHPRSRFAVHCDCAASWIAARSSREDEQAPPYDVVIVDIEDGGQDGDEVEELVAPPRAFLSPDFLGDVRRSLAPGGIVAMNVVGTPAAAQSALQAVGDGWPLHSHALCKAPSTGDGMHYILFSCDGDIASGAELQAALAAAESPLVDDGAAWVKGYRRASVGTDVAALF
jgi:spermidine synthase